MQIPFFSGVIFRFGLFLRGPGGFYSGRPYARALERCLAEVRYLNRSENGEMVILFSHLNLAVIAQLSAVSFLTAHLIALQASNSLESPNFDAGDDPLLDGSEWCFFYSGRRALQKCCRFQISAQASTLLNYRVDFADCKPGGPSKLF